MRRVLHPQEFVNIVMAEAPKAQVHVIKYGEHFPQMSDPLWREEVRNIFLDQCIGEHRFTGPDELDDNWQFCGTGLSWVGTPIFPALIPEEKDYLGYAEMHEDDEVIGQPLGPWDYALILAMSIFIAVAVVVIGIIVFTGLGGIQ